MMIGRDSALTGGVGNPEMTDAERRLANVVNYGRVVEADYASTPARVRVGIGDEEDPEGYILTGWLPFSHGRSNEWNPLKIGEAVTVIAEGGELQTATVIPGSIHNEDNPAPGDRGDLYRKKFADDSVIEYDEAAGTMKLTGKTSFEASVGEASIKVLEDSIVLTAGGKTFTLSADGVESSGKIKGSDGLEVQGDDFTHKGKNVGATHKHLGVTTGGGISGVVQ